MNNFDKLIGQEAVKRQLAFHLAGHKARGRSPFLLLLGAKGLGKTTFAKAYGKELKDTYKPENGGELEFVELNCSAFKNLESFLAAFKEGIEHRNTIVLLDEVHCLKEDLTNAFLTIFNPKKESKSEFWWEEMLYEFDFMQQTFIFATTESDKIFPPLRDRMTPIGFELYSQEELGQIIATSLPNISITEDTLELMATTVRDNARQAIKLSEYIESYCATWQIDYFDMECFNDLSYHIDILPYGISRIEQKALEILNNGDCTLTALAAKLGLSKTAVQRDHELYLLSKDFIEIDGKRRITRKGRELLAQTQT